MFLCSYNSGEGFHIKSSIGVLNVSYLAFFRGGLLGTLFIVGEHKM